MIPNDVRYGPPRTAALDAFRGPPVASSLLTLRTATLKILQISSLALPLSLSGCTLPGLGADAGAAEPWRLTA